MDPDTEYIHELTYLYSLQKHGIKFGLSQTSYLLEKMGSPHLNQNYIHIAGTNGKGSVASFLFSILKQSDYKVGLYTSPHLVRFTERIKIGSQEIPRKRFTSLMKEIRSIFFSEEPPTFFEAVTALALKYFAQEKTDIVILEVGMGGRLDATNIVVPRLSMITNISLEHQEFLGNSLMEIAEEKSGVIKPGVPLIAGVEQTQIQKLLHEKCIKNTCTLYLLDRDFKYQDKFEKLDYQGLNSHISGLKPNLTGKHQFRNAALAIAAIEILDQNGFTIKSRDIRQGLKSTVWPGRLEVVKQTPTIILDGAHNPEALKALKNTLQRDFSFEDLYLILGIMADKDVNTLLGIILPVSDFVIYTRPSYSRALSPRELELKALPWQKEGTTTESIPDAIDRAREKANSRDLILVTGSLFTIGEALSYFDPINYAPEI